MHGRCQIRNSSIARVNDGARKPYREIEIAGIIHSENSSRSCAPLWKINGEVSEARVIPLPRANHSIYGWGARP